MKTIVWFGLIAGLVLIGLTSAGEAIFGMEPESFDAQEVYGYASMVLGLSMIFFGVRQYRDQVAGGTASFAMCLKVGLLADLVAATVYGLYMMVYFRWIRPDFMETYSNFYRQQISSSGLPEAEIGRQLADFDANLDLFMDPTFNSVVMFATVFLVGVLVAVVTALILRDQPKRNQP